MTDLRQLGQLPDAAEIVRISDGALSFHVARFEDPDVRLRPVRYERVPARDGLQRLERTEIDPSGRYGRRILPDTPLAHCRFDLLVDRLSQRRFIRLRFAVAGDGQATGAAVETSQMRAIVVALRSPGGIGVASLRPACRVVADAPLLP